MLAMLVRQTMLYGLLILTIPICSGRKPDGFHVIDPSKYADQLGTDYLWAIQNVPFVDVPDHDVLTAYYYRWRSYRKHIKWTGDEDGYVVTEFLPDVPWSGKHNTISAAAGHHILEGRWIHNERYLNDYTKFWYSSADPSSYTNWIGHAAWQRYLLNGNITFISSLTDAFAKLYRETYVPKYLKSMNGTKQCWWQDDGWDAMEVSISGRGCRPTIASVMYGEADVIIKLATKFGTGNQTLAEEFRKWRELSRSVVVDLHWNEAIQSFATIPLNPHSADDYLIRFHRQTAAPANIAEACNMPAVRVENQTANVRELLGFMPFYYESLIPNELLPTFLPMWKELFDPDGFQAEFGLRTAERRHGCYNYSFDHGDCWNGPSWPYETSRVLTSAANLLNNDRMAANGYLTVEKYWTLLKQYARQHTVTVAENDTARVPGSGHVFENLHPDLGYWNNRARMYWRNDTNKDMGDDYNHSTFIDLILSGLLGIRPQEDGSIRIHPLLPLIAGKSWAVDHVLISGGRILSMVWDNTQEGSVYGLGKGLTVLLDGRVATRRESLAHLLESPINLPRETLYTNSENIAMN